MKDIPFYVITCDKTAWILKSFAYLADKFYPREYKILGFKECPKLPANFQFISMADKQESIQLWTKYIYDIIKKETNEFVFFGLDDYLMISSFDKEAFDYAFDVMKLNKNVMRYELGWCASRKKELYLLNETSIFRYNHFSMLTLFKYSQTTSYRISCQISIWRTEYLLNYLKNNWTPWEFEIKGTEKSINDGSDVLCTTGSYALRWIEESALSKRHDGMVNVLGLRHDLIYDLVERGYIKQEQVQYGMGKGEVPTTFNKNLPGKKYEKFYV